MSTSAPIPVDSADVTYEPQTYIPETGLVTAAQYLTVRAASSGAYPKGALVQWSNPPNAVDGAIAPNGQFVLYQGAPADYVAVVVGE